MKISKNLFDQRRYQDAMDSLKKAAEIEPNNPEVWHFLGYIHGATGNYEFSKMNIEKAIELNPLNNVYFSDLGCAYLNMNNLEEALDKFDKSIEIESNYPNVWYYRANTLQKLGDLEKSHFSVKKSIELGLDAIEVWELYGNVSELLVKRDEALFAYERILTINPDLLIYQLSKADILFYKEKHEEAISIVKEVIEKDPKESLAYATLQKFYKYLGQDRIAYEWSQKALEHLPDDKHAKWARTLERLENPFDNIGSEKSEGSIIDNLMELLDGDMKEIKGDKPSNN